MNWLSKSAVAVFSVIGIAAPEMLNAQSGNMVPPAGAVTWHYQCKSGECPTRCTISGTELFSTGSYFALTVVQLPNHGYWVRIDTGQKNIDYVAGTDQLACSISGATLMPLPAK